MNKSETYEMLKSLGNYLKTKIEVLSGTIEINARHNLGSLTNKKVGGHIIKVTISNTVPVVTDWPAIVFTGVGLIVKFPKSLHGSIQNMKNLGNLFVDLTNAPQSSPFVKPGCERIDGTDYPAITQDELRQGHVLFPGCSITYEMKITSKRCPDVKELKFWVEGNVSRRHLFHVVKELSS
jgi:hypothetical protein